ncbi:ABC-F family ATP-binding cassette domain-containing protein [Bacillaceae bacterium S4-13-58]
MEIMLKEAKKIFGGNVIFENITFEMNDGDRVGLVGRNGTGKTTIFKLFMQKEPLDEGQLFLKKGTKVGYLDQIPEVFTGTVREFLREAFQDLLDLRKKMSELEEEMKDPNKLEKTLLIYGEVQEQFSQKGGYEMEANLERVSSGLGLIHLLDEKYSSLSGGERTKAGLAKILLEEPDVLLLDEPTNHLDLQAIEWLEKYITEYKGTVCIISHDRTFLDQTVTKIADLDNGELTIYTGNYSSFVQEKEAKLLEEFQQYQEQQRKIKKMKEAIKCLKLWANQANPPNAGLHRRARNMERALDRLEKIDRPLLDPKTMGLAFEMDQRTGKDVFIGEDLVKSFDNKVILDGVNLHLQFKDKLAVVGPNGSGKTTLIKMIMGELEPDSGSVKRGTQLKIGYLSQHSLQHVDPSIRMIDFFREYIRVHEGEARQILSRFLFYGHAVFQKIGQLSGGEQMRVQLAIFMYQGVNVLILDEPTNHLDVDSQEVLEEAVKQFKGTVLCISHDRYFLNKCFQDTAYMVRGKLIRFPGNYEETKAKALHLQMEDKQAIPKKEKEKPVKMQSERKQFSIEEVEEEIERIEVKMEKWEWKMNNSQDPNERMDIQLKMSALEKERDQKYQHLFKMER